jgi:hypothetical protein
MQFKLTEIEDGYARVERENGRAMGYVVRDSGLRGGTSFVWLAMAGTKREVGSGHTRREAVEKLVAYAEAKDARLAQWIGRS